MATDSPTDRLHFTGDEEADRLLVTEPMALLIGFALDQQVTVQKAFGGPLEIQRRVGTLDPYRLADMDPEDLAAVFRRVPALHRYPTSMAERVQSLARHIVDRYGGDARRVWADASDATDLTRRVAALPGFGEMKVRGLTAVLAKRLGVRPPGIDEVLATYPTLGDVDSPQALAEYQAKKRAYKAAMRAAKD
jgi:uncharacterized HhH-GPD family protein